ncbi:MAG TPA: alpha/beta fold hydrolase, partial [Candidatus Thermoplasmatota archaeon]|nr:alpha/beta fold hydrolase [Candidatus Thermoplasmatota archaeon]
MRIPEDIARAMPFARRDVQVGDVRVSMVDEGDGEPVLFVHGNPTWSYLWRHLMRPAREAGLRVVAPDHAGFGASDKPTDPTYYSLERHVANLRAVVRALDLRDITLVLHDWGGPIGMGLAVEEPERIARICICNTVAFAPKEKRPLTKWHAWLSTPWGYRAGVWLNAVERSAMKLGVAKPLPREALRAYAWPMRERGGRVAAARFVQMVPDGPQHPTAATLRRYQAAYPTLARKPMLVLWADKDRVMRPRFAKRWLEDFPHAEVRHVAPDAGHFWQEDAPELFAPHIVRFARAEAG